MVSLVVLVGRGFLAGTRGERQEWRRQLSFFDGLLLGPVSLADAPAEGPEVTQGRSRQESGSQSLTCGEGGGGEAAPLGILGRLQEHCVVCALRQALQPDPRVLCIHDQLLWNEPEEG